MKKLPEKYSKIWQYMVDSNQPINEDRIAGLLQELFVDRLTENKNILKNNLKTMKVKAIFDLRGDGWMQSVLREWERTFEPELNEEVQRIKRISDIKDRGPAMRGFLHTLSAGTTPMNVLSVMEDNYTRKDEAPDVEPIEDIPEDSPGFLRRAARSAGRGAGLAGVGVVGSMMTNTKMMGTIVRGAVGLFGMAKAIRSGFTNPSPRGAAPRARSVFGMGRSTNVRAKQTNFTPREDELEGGGIKDILNKIEDNTAKLLAAFGGKKDDKNKGILTQLFGSLLSGAGGIARSLVGGLRTFFGPMLALLTPVLRSLGPILTAAIDALKWVANKLGLKNIPKALEGAGAALRGGLATAGEVAGNVARAALPALRAAGGVGMMLYSEEAGKGSDIVGPTEAQRQVYKVLKDAEFEDDKGNKVKLTKEQIAGIMGNIQAESGFKPDAHNKEGGGRGAFGLAQWRADRLDKLESFAKSKGKPITDATTQAEFLVEELKGTQGKGAGSTLQNLLKAKTSKEASDTWVTKFERPFAGKSDEFKEKQLANRAKMSENFIGAEKTLGQGPVAPTAKPANWAPGFHPTEKPAHLQGGHIVGKAPNLRASKLTPAELDTTKYLPGNNINVVAPAGTEKGTNTTGARPTHTDKDDSYLKLQLESQQHAFQ